MCISCINFCSLYYRMPAESISRQTWLDCVELRHMYECDPNREGDHEYYSLKEPWASNGADAVPNPRKRTVIENTTTVTPTIIPTIHQPTVQRRIDGKMGYASGVRSSHLAAASACRSCGDTPGTSNYGGKHGSYERYLLKKKGGYLR
jgi:hypothetical protein